MNEQVSQKKAVEEEVSERSEGERFTDFVLNMNKASDHLLIEGYRRVRDEPENLPPGYLHDLRFKLAEAKSNLFFAQVAYGGGVEYDVPFDEICQKMAMEAGLSERAMPLDDTSSSHAHASLYESVFGPDAKPEGPDSEFAAQARLSRPFEPPTATEMAGPAPRPPNAPGQSGPAPG